MKSEIFLISLLLIGCALADPETTDTSEKPEGESQAPAKEGESATEVNSVTDGVFVSAVDNKLSEDNKTAEENKSVETKKDVEDNKPSEDTNQIETSTAGSSGEEASGMKLKEPSGEETTTSASKEELSDNSIKKDAGSDLLDAASSGTPDTTPGSKEDTTENTTDLNKAQVPDQPANEETTTSGAGGSGEESSKKSAQNGFKSHKAGDTTSPPKISPQASGGDSSGKTENNVSDVKPLEIKLTAPAEVKAPEIQTKKVEIFNTDVDKPKALGFGHAVEIAEHKMSVTEQRALVCSLPKTTELCSMVVDLEQKISITEPMTDLYCKSLAASMGYNGHCVALMKTDPHTLEAIFTPTCAYFETPKSKCSTNFITTKMQTDMSQVPYNCSNGISYYVPTSCLKRNKEIVLN